jgi:Protein of unknown function (DUF2865)
MRLSGFPAQCLVVTAVLGLATGPALSQSFFQNLFGFGDSKPAAKVEAKRADPKPVTSLRSLMRSRPSGSGSSSRNSESDSDGDATPAEEDNPSGPYRTLCVRTCDGYYFPISPRASQSRFKRDAKMCKKMCGQDAKLFFMDRDSTNMKSMQDVDGQPYTKLPQAFAYRKSLVSGCACKAMPWSDSEQARHAMYSVAAAVEKSQRDVFERQLAQAKAGAEAKLATAAVPAASNQATAVIQLASAKSDALVLHLVPGGAEPTIDPVSDPGPEVAPVRLKRAGDRSRRAFSRFKAKPRRVQTASAQPSGGSKALTWPGDAPARVR